MRVSFVIALLSYICNEYDCAGWRVKGNGIIQRCASIIGLEIRTPLREVVNVDFVTGRELFQIMLGPSTLIGKFPSHAAIYARYKPQLKPKTLCPIGSID